MARPVVQRLGRWWILISNLFWICFWLYDLASGSVDVGAARDLLGVIVLISGVIAEDRAWRIAPLLNIGYYVAMGLWLLGYGLSHPDPDTGDTAVVILVVGFPMIVTAFINAFIYRWRS